MDLWNAINGRRAVRQYETEPIDRMALQKLIDAASMAPSNMNNQPWHYHIVSGPKRDALVKILNRSTLMLADIFADMDEAHVELAMKFFSDCGGAPVVIVVSAPETEDDEYKRLVDAIGCGCSIQNLQLAAYAEGLATCVLTISFWVKAEIAKFLRIHHRDVICCVLVGKPAQTPETPPRRGNVVTWVGT